eukprot:15459038-Alexandrium_andersonii.AAC.1
MSRALQSQFPVATLVAALSPGRGCKRPGRSFGPNDRGHQAHGADAYPQQPDERAQRTERTNRKGHNFGAPCFGRQKRLLKVPKSKPPAKSKTVFVTVMDAMLKPAQLRSPGF